MSTMACSYCGESFVVGLRWCPHCARPSLFPNVDLAGAPEETEALARRYQAQVERAEALGQEAALMKFEQHVAGSCACKGMPRWELERLVASDTATAATYYQQIDGRSRIPDDNRWDRLRRIADAAFFQAFGEDIHFAALSTDGKWLTSYGDGAVFFKDNMISHRATVFEKNTATWVEDSGALQIPPGHRAIWNQRSHLAVAKLGEVACSGPCDVSSLLLSCGHSSADDSFMEVHIYGGFTIRSTDAIVLRRGALSELGRADVIDRTKRLGISFTELP